MSSVPELKRLAQAMRLQVRCMDGDAFWVNTAQDATVASIKESIAEQRGIDVIMQKLICTGRVLQDEAMVNAYGLSECDFLVLVTAKPRPPSLITTGAPLPPSYSTNTHAGDDGYGMDGAEDDGGEEEGELDDSGHVDADESLVGRLVAMGFEPHESRDALRVAQNDTSLALAMLRSGHLSVDADALRSLEHRLRATDAFGHLQEVVRVDPQVMLVLNTHDVRFEDQRTSQRMSRVTLERLGMERAFLDACRKELSSQPPVFDRLLQLLREVRDSVSSLMEVVCSPSGCEEQLLASADVFADVSTCVHEAHAAAADVGAAAADDYVRGVGRQVEQLRARVSELSSTLATAQSAASAASDASSSTNAASSAACSALPSCAATDDPARIIGVRPHRGEGEDSTEDDDKAVDQQTASSALCVRSMTGTLENLYVSQGRLTLDELAAQDQLELDKAERDDAVADEDGEDVFGAPTCAAAQAESAEAPAVDVRTLASVVSLEQLIKKSSGNGGGDGNSGGGGGDGNSGGGGGDGNSGGGGDGGGDGDSSDGKALLGERSDCASHGGASGFSASDRRSREGSACSSFRGESDESASDASETNSDAGGCSSGAGTSADRPFPAETSSGQRLLSFARDIFKQLQELKLEVANAQLSHLLSEDDSLRGAIAAQPADFVTLLNVSEGELTDEYDRDASPHESSEALFSRLTQQSQAARAEGMLADLEALRRFRPARPHRRHRSEECDADDDLRDEMESGRTADEASARESFDAELRGLEPALLGQLPAHETNSELMEAVMQQWLHTPAGQAAAQDAARMHLGAAEIGQYFHGRMLQSLGRLRLDSSSDNSAELLRPQDAHLSEEDEEAVAMLTALGYSRAAVVEAYLACDRDQNLAANFLMDQ